MIKKDRLQHHSDQVFSAAVYAYFETRDQQYKGYKIPYLETLNLFKS